MGGGEVVGLYTPSYTQVWGVERREGRTATPPLSLREGEKCMSTAHTQSNTHTTSLSRTTQQSLSLAGMEVGLPFPSVPTCPLLSLHCHGREEREGC